MILPFFVTCILLTISVHGPPAFSQIYESAPYKLVANGLDRGDALICREREPCGFYMSGAGSRRREWISSWCKCDGGRACIATSLNSRLKITVHTCERDSAETN